MRARAGIAFTAEMTGNTLPILHRDAREQDQRHKEITSVWVEEFLSDGCQEDDAPRSNDQAL